MPFPIINPSETNAWQALRTHFYDVQHVTMQELFATDALRTEKFHVVWENFLLDYSKNRITEKTIELLLDLANQVQLREAIDAQFNGEKINQTEGRAVLHTALRANEEEVYNLQGNNIIPEIFSVKSRIKSLADSLSNNTIKGFTNKAFTDIVNIGVGGSDLGPAMVTEALQFYRNHLNVHFISNIDGDHVTEILKKINPETTLFIVVSKSFTTQETITNAETVKKWFLNHAQEEDIKKHFIAVSTEIDKAEKFGIDPSRVFPIWDWVGGRFSLWSAVGLSIVLSVGFENFEKLLAGANKMDNHFRTTPFSKNIPVLMALVSIWYNNFYEAESEAIIPYSQYLQKFVPYLQQGIMESNGKNIGRDGNPVNYQTGTIIWGEPGTNCQHAFFQLIHQGTKLIPTDFIGFKKPLHDNREHHLILMSNFFAQTEALLNGKTAQQVKEEFSQQNISETMQNNLLPHKVFEGNKPTNTLLIDTLTPESLGSLIALYEHKLFTQGVIWNIYSYDQWGVELGKQLAHNILQEIQSGEIALHDTSTQLLLKKFLED